MGSFKKSLSLQCITKLVLLFLVFILPFQVSDIVYQGDFFTGKFSSYSTFSLYLQDIVLAVFLILLGFLWRQGKVKIHFGFIHSKIFLLLAIAYLYVLIQTFILGGDFLNVLQVLRLGSIFLFYLAFQSNILSKEEVHLCFFLTILFQIGIALMQYLSQNSVGLYFLGESHLSQNLVGVAKVDFAGSKIIRGYGTLPHPNILAAYIALVFCLAISYYQKQKILISFLLIWLLAGLYITLSRGVIIGLILSLAFYFVLTNRSNLNKKYFYLISFFMISYLAVIWNLDLLRVRFSFLDIQNLLERKNQILSSLYMIKDHPFGLGLGNFVSNLQNYSFYALKPWEFQSVHNTLLLVSSELGIIVLSLLLFSFLYCFSFFYKKEKYFHFSLLLFIFLIAQTDHYLYDIYSGQILLAFSLAQLADPKFST